MEKNELAKNCLNTIYVCTKKEELYPFFTKDTIFYDIDNNTNVSMEEMISVLKKYQEFDIEWLESAVSIKAFLKNESGNFHIYFAVKRNRIIRLEFAVNI